MFLIELLTDVVWPLTCLAVRWMFWALAFVVLLRLAF